MTSLLELRGVGKVFGGGFFGGKRKMALDGISLRFDADRPRIVAVVGESGSGKTTLAQILLGFLPQTTGSVRYEGRELARLSAAGRREFRKSVQAVLQDPFSAFNPFYRVDHALSAPLQTFGVGSGAGDRLRRMQTACEQVGLNPGDTLGRFPHQLSGGQRQRLMVARALMLAPKVIVADEPVSMVDASLRASILGNLAELRRDYGISIVYITHDLTTAYHVADWVLVLYRGRIVETGSADDVLRNPQHPYTQLLMDSVPWPDLDRRWGQRPLVAGGHDVAPMAGGCPFRERCPEATARCAAELPPWRVVTPGHVAACWYRGSDTVATGEEVAAGVAGAVGDLGAGSDAGASADVALAAAGPGDPKERDS